MKRRRKLEGRKQRVASTARRISPQFGMIGQRLPAADESICFIEVSFGHSFRDVKYYPKSASEADDIQDTTPQREPHQLNEVILGLPGVIDSSLLERATFGGGVGIPDFQRIRQ